MAKTKHHFECNACGHVSTQWMGKCTSCGGWNTFEEVKQTIHKKGKDPVMQDDKPVHVAEVKRASIERLDVGDPEFNRVLGGGLVPGSVVLLAGEPGIGKSTILLQCALAEAKSVLYVSGEESKEQIAMRADRIAASKGGCHLFTDTDIDHVVSQIKKGDFHWIVIDSIQTMQSSAVDSAPGTITQIREGTSKLISVAKATQTPIIIVGHVTKEGSIAGPKILEHMVDVVLQFEGDQNGQFRMIRAVKNRFGSTNELSIYEMDGDGLKSLHNPSELFMNYTNSETSGIVSAASVEGVRPLIVEVQALVSSAIYATPQRSCTGYDPKRLNMLLAVLEKKCGFKLGAKDVFLNIAGGLKISDPAVDLAVAMAVISSLLDVAVPKNVCLAGEVGLSGEIRPAQRVEQRIQEAQLMGFKGLLVSAYGKMKADKHQIRIGRVQSVTDAFQKLFK